VEQGDPLGGIQAGSVILQAVDGARAELAEAGIGFFDCWYLDGGQIFCAEQDVDIVLRVLDKHFEAAGATRGSGSDVKSVARVLGLHPDDGASGDDWATEYVRSTCQVRAPSEVPLAHVLGVDTDVEGGEGSAFSKQFGEVCEKVAAVHQRLTEVEDGPAELTLLRSCASVCKVTHLLRAAGIYLPQSDLNGFDRTVSEALQRVLGCELPGPCLEQSAQPTCQGGLGLARSSQLAAAAFVSARVEAEPLVHLLLGGLSAVTGDLSALEGDYEQELEKGKAALSEQLSAEGRVVADELIAAAEGEATKHFAALMGGRRPHDRPPAERAEADLVLPAGAEDAEGPEQRRLQGELARVLGAEALSGLAELYRRAGDWPSMRRVRELRDPTVCHGWLQALNPVHGPSMSPEDYIDAVRLRLGAPFQSDESICPRCDGTLDRAATHSQTCAVGESTRGHYRVCASVLQLAALGDPESSTEPVGLAPSCPTLRPADVLTSATSCGLAALDIGVCSPEAAGAGLDCCEAMYRRKLAHYRQVLPELQASGIRYMPMVWSCHGRAHPEAMNTLQLLARTAARRKGLRDWRPLLARARCSIAVQLQKRLVAQLHACLRDTQAEVEGFADAADEWQGDRVPTDEEATAHLIATALETSPADVVTCGAAGASAPPTFSDMPAREGTGLLLVE